jgi:hypothetical protein
LALLLSSVAGCWTPAVAQTSRPAKETTTEEVPLQVIVVRSSEEARQVLQRLKKGEDFAVLAKKESIDPTADAGGYMGTMRPGALRAELRNALRNVGPGEVSSIARIPSGYAILKVMKDTSAAAKTADPARNFALAASGAVKYVTDVDGLAEAELALLRFPKAADWNGDPHQVCELRKQSLARVVGRMKAYLASESPEGVAARSPLDEMQLHFSLAQLYAYEGQMDPAIEEYQVSYKLALSDVRSAVPQMAEALGIIYLHKSEMENDAYRAPGKKCLFPMRPEDAYKKTENSQRSVEYFLKYLAEKPDELEVLWLLNVAYMTLGKYPDGVPPKYLLPPSSFESREDIGRFEDVASEIGLRSFSTAGGVIADDFENNGLLDVVTSGFDSCASMHYFHNNGDGTFSDQTAKAGLSDQVGGLNIIQTDYNNDGCIDILVLRGGWEFPQRKSLLRNNCDGTFTDVTLGSGLDEPTSSQAAVWTDINNDGLLDLFVGNENGLAQLFLNKGDGTFQDIAIASGVSGDGTAFSKGVAAADYDNDGYVDLYVSNQNGPNFLYHNNHDNTFTEVTYRAGVPGSGKGFATWFFDYDNDGLPDLLATSYFASVDDTVRTYLGLAHNAGTLKLYRNMGDGTFRDVTSEVGLDKVFMPMGANFGDVDNDGYLDIYLGTGNPSYASIVPNVLLRNHDGKYFVDITTSSGTGELHKGHGIAFADLANRGSDDIVAEVGGATLGDSHALRVFKNPGNGNDWITVKLVGVKTNRVGIDARIKVTVENEAHARRSIYRTVGSGGSFGASPLQQHIGLGKSARIISLEVYWPVSRTRQIFHDVDKNQFLEIKEFADVYTKLDRSPFELGGAENNLAHLPQAAREEPAAKN